MKTLTLFFLLLAAMTQAQIDSIPVDTVETPTTKYVILDFKDYCEFNADISVAKGYTLNKSTERVFPLFPERFTLLDKNPNKGMLMAVITINPENQQYCTYPLLDFNEIVFKDTIIDEMTIKLKVKSKDWYEKHLAKTGTQGKTYKFE